MNGGFVFVITADQVDSRSHADLVSTMIDSLGATLTRPLLPVERTVGDELQMLLAEDNDALAAILHLTRTEQWSVGCGVGPVATPLPESIREATGGAFIAARRAVERAKKRQTRFALETEPATHNAASAEALINLLLALRARRSPEGWELYDILNGTGTTQAEAAQKLGISPQAVSLRARAGELRTEWAAQGPLRRMLGDLGGADPAAKGNRS